MSDNSMTRRKAIVGGVSVLGVGTAATAFTGTTEAASVSFNLPDSSFERAEAVDAARITVSADVQWDANQAPDGWELRLFVGPDLDTLDMLTYTLEEQGVQAQGDATVQLGGKLRNSDHFSAADFALPESGERTQTVAARLDFGLRSNGDRVVTQSAETTMQLTLKNGTITADMGIEASGSVSVE